MEDVGSGNVDVLPHKERPSAGQSVWFYCYRTSLLPGPPDLLRLAAACASVGGGDAGGGVDGGGGGEVSLGQEEKLPLMYLVLEKRRRRRRRRSGRESAGSHRGEQVQACGRVEQLPPQEADGHFQDVSLLQLGVGLLLVKLCLQEQLELVDAGVDAVPSHLLHPGLPQLLREREKRWW